MWPSAEVSFVGTSSPSLMMWGATLLLSEKRRSARVN